MRTLTRGALVVLVCLVGACALPYRGGARAISPGQVSGERWLRAAPTPVIVQKRQTDCGLAALAMVAGAWGRTWSLDDLAHRVPPGERGIKLRVLRDIARARGFEAYAIRGTRADLRTELAAGRPVLIGLMLPHDMRRNRSHYEVAIALDARDGTLITIDPATGDWMRRSPKVLDVEWKEAGYATLVVVADKTPVRREVVGGAP